MKRIIIVGFALFLSTMSFAQSNKDLDKNLLVKYTKQELKEIKNSDPKEYEYLKYCVNNAFYIAAASKEKIKASPNQYKEVTLKNISVANFYDLKIDVLDSEYQTFLIEGTEKILIVKSKVHILRELKNK